LLTEAHAYLSVVLNCSRFSLPASCLSPPPPATTDHPPHTVCQLFPLFQNTHGERICSSFGRQKVKHGLLLLIHILWVETKLTGTAVINYISCCQDLFWHLKGQQHKRSTKPVSASSQQLNQLFSGGIDVIWQSMLPCQMLTVECSPILHIQQLDVPSFHRKPSSVV
jgi:hypothetical protein